MNKLDTRAQIAVIMLNNALVSKYINDQQILVIVTKLDRYLITQLIGPFAFFCFITSGILLLNQSLKIIDLVTENKQPIYIALELTLLLLPKVLITAIPISAFIASILIVNRLFNEEELLVMMSIGQSYVSLSKPFIIFGIFASVLLYSVVHNLAPFAHSNFIKADERIRKDFALQIFEPDQFVSYQNKYTFFFGSKSEDKSLNDVLIEEQISQELTLTHIAEKGQVVSKRNLNSLILKNGTTQSYNRRTDEFSLLYFEKLVFDLNQLNNDNAITRKSLSSLSTSKLKKKINNLKLKGKTGRRFGRATSLVHDRIVKTFLTLLFPLLGMLSLMLGGFNRFGYSKRIISCILTMASLDLLRGACKSWVIDNPSIWLIQYTSPLLCIIIILLIFFLVSNSTNGLIKIKKLVTI
jgi:lipopolysaccharide export system permease protein